MKKVLLLVLSWILLLSICGCEYLQEASSDSQPDTVDTSDSTESPSFPVYRLKEIESIVLDTKGYPVAEALESFYRDVHYVYYFTSMVSEYVIVTYTDKSTENVKDALANLHIKISDLDRFGIEYHKWVDDSVEKILLTSESGDDAIEPFYETENNVYQFPRVMSHNVIVYYKDGTRENVKDALAAGDWERIENLAAEASALAKKLRA